jgi:hypothetical protein
LPMPDKPDWKDTRRSVGDLLFDWSFAMNASFRIFGDLQVQESDVSVSSYPPSPLRRFMATSHAIQFVMHGWNLSDTKVAANALKRGAIYTEIAFMKMMNQEYGGKGLAAFSASGKEYAKKIAEYVDNTLAEKLEQFAYERIR